MKLPPTEVATFLRRMNLFSALVMLEGQPEVVYLPSSGRMTELLTRGQRVFLTDKAAPGRKTRYDLSLVDLGHLLVSVDSRIPSKLVLEALRRKYLSPFKDYPYIKSEPMVADGRLDFLLRNNSQSCLLEVKSVTLVRRRRALFPDAPTPRGRRHLAELVNAKEQGQQAAIIFVAQRSDAECFSPHDEIDSDFGQALRKAQRRGVAIHAYNCLVSLDRLELDREIPVTL